MIKAVLFDAGGVLHIANTAVGDDLQKELNLSEEQTKSIFSHYLPLLGTGKMREQEMWDELRAKWGIRQVLESEHLFTREFVTTLEKMPGMYQLVDELKARGLKVALLTNVTPQFAEVLEARGHYAPFDSKILSFQVGIWKPDRDIYHLALRQLQVEPEEAVFVDDQEKNVTAARELGIHGIIFHDSTQTKAELEELIE